MRCYLAEGRTATNESRGLSHRLNFYLAVNKIPQLYHYSVLNGTCVAKVKLDLAMDYP